MTDDIAEFAARRRAAQDEAIAALLPSVREFIEKGVDGVPGLAERLTQLYVDTYLSEGGERQARTAAFLHSMRSVLVHTEPDSDPTTTATWLAVATINAATVQAAADDPAPKLLRWTTMHDSKVREAHAAADRQRRPAGAYFHVGGENLRYPGDPRGRIDNTINCRCVLQKVPFYADASAVSSDPWTSELSSITPSPDLVTASTGLEPSTRRATAPSPSEGSPPSTPTGSHGSLPTASSPSRPSSTTARTADASTSSTSRTGPSLDRLRQLSRTGQPRPTAPRVTSTQEKISSGSSAEMALASGSAENANGSTPTTGGVRRRQFTGVQSASHKETPMPLDTPLAWHGVLAPEDEWSGDGRRFATNSLRNRDLPLPLTWQKASSDGHNTSVVIGRIDSIERVDGMMRGEGTFVDTPETDEFVGLLAEFGKFGVSVDADDSEFEFDEESGQVTFTSARIASACCVAIPAFSSAFITFGTWADEMAAPPFPPKKADVPVDDTAPVEEECDPNAPDYEDCLARKAQDQAPADDMIPSLAESDGYSLATAGPLVEMISDAAWDGSAGRFSPEQWKASCVLHVCTGDEKSCHKLPIREPGGALSRAGVHAAASRFNQVDAPSEAKASAARQLRGAYKQLGEEPPDVLKAAGETESFGRGPGWVTNPEDTRRIWAYWTQPGHEGYAKINWGVPGDFSRCRLQVGEEIGESSPDKLRFINQICAQWHHDATGFWPGHAPAEVASASLVSARSVLAAAAPTLERAGVERVGLGQVMAVATGGSHRETSPKVLRPGDRLQVWGVDAKSYSAEVVKIETLRDGAVLSLVGEDVSTGALPSAIAVVVPRPEPNAALAIHADEIVELRLRSEFCLACGSEPSIVPLAHAASKTASGALVVGNNAHTIHTSKHTPQSPNALSLVASGAKEAPASWFDDPKLSGPTHLTVTRDGRVFGHIAEWKTCHIGYEGVCVAPPSSATDYAYFATGQVLLDNGQSARTGVISLGGGHAGPGLRFRAASAHYDSTSAAVADVSVGEDEYGIWCAGWVRPGVTEEQVVALRASDISGDWRDINGKSEMIAALAVNVAGFPTVSVQDRVQVSLVAAGVIQLREDDINQVIQRAAAYAVEAHFARRDRMAKLITRVHERI